MNKRSGLFWGVVVSIALGSCFSWAYPIADTLQYPLDSYIVGANHFGAYDLVRANSWHLGDDVAATAGTSVFAAGNGVVRRAQIQNGYGGTYIIEHNVNGEKMCALYVHMDFASFTKNVGDEVGIGEYLGQVGNYNQNGGWPVHFHFGIRKGEYPAYPNVYIYGDWIFSGYTYEESVLNDWYNPSAFIAAHSQPPYQVTFDYPDFTSVGGLNLVGSTLQSVDVLQLTSAAHLQAGAAWFVEKQHIQNGFETTFTFWISGDGADGFAFVIQNYSDSALGANGSGLGYQGVPNSLAVEFDTWRNCPGDAGFSDYDVNDNHIGVHTLGLEPNSAGPQAAYPDALQGETTAIPFLSDGQIHTAKISYIPGVLAIYVDDLAVPALNVPIDIASLLSLDNGAAWVGFTGSTGGATEIHDILNWSFAINSALPKPDLTASLVVSPAILHVGDTATVSGTVDNGPDADAAACQATISFDGQTATVDVPAISAGQSAVFSQNFNLTTAGTQTVTVTADSSNAITESNEGNNIAGITVTVLPPLRPDLVVSSLNVSKQKGKAIVEVGVGNIGTAPAGNFGLRLEVLETGEKATASISSLADGTSVIKSFTLKKAPRGTLTFRATVDPDSLIVESDETNNLLVVSKQL